MTTHMHSFGCFGSILAHDVTSAACSSCPVRDVCADKVAAKQPTILKFLSHFADGQGNSIATAWAKRSVRKPKRASKSATPVQLPVEIENLKDRVDNRLHRAIDNAFAAGIDLFTCPIVDLGVTKSAAVMLSELATGSKAIPYLIDTLTKRYNSTQMTARRNVFAFRSLLVETKRARQTGQLLEII